jgi:hypothetical protein
LKDFKSYTPEDDENNSCDVNKNIQDSIPKNTLDMVKNLAKQYHGKSEDEMMSAIFKEAEKNRKNGSLSDKDLDNFLSIVSPLIDNDKKAKLKNVVDKLKNNK